MKATKKTKAKKHPIIGVRLPRDLHLRVASVAKAPPLRMYTREAYAQALEEWLATHGPGKSDNASVIFRGLSDKEKALFIDVLLMLRHEQARPEFAAALSIVRAALVPHAALLRRLGHTIDAS